MAYDFNKWMANEASRMKRHVWVPWYLAFLMIVPLLMAILEVFDDGVEEERFASATSWIFVMLALSMSPFAKDMFRALGGQASTDEFERHALARATSRAYSVVLVMALILCAWCWLGTAYGWPMPRTPLDWSSWGIAFLTIGVALPIFFAEIMVPLPPEGDELEE